MLYLSVEVTLGERKMRPAWAFCWCVVFSFDQWSRTRPIRFDSSRRCNISECDKIFSTRLIC